MKKQDKIIKILAYIVLLWLCMILILAVVFIKSAKDYKTIIVEKNNIKDTTNDIIEETIIEEPQIVELPNNYQTRLTSFYANDGYGTGSCTGTGLCESDFQVNENGWYTYQGKLVLATATPYLLNYGYNLSNNVETYRYYDELQIVIDGINYDAIVLDSCGACMGDNRIDLFVSNSSSVKDTIVEVLK